jgi:hypothetical protein
MNSTKLVLGFCALTAIGGSAAHGAGAPAAHQVPEEALAEMNRLAEEDDRVIALLGLDELTLVRNALSNEHEAYFLLGFAADELDAACERANGMRREIAIAKKIAQKAWFSFTKRKKNARVETLELKLAKAEEDMPQRYSSLCLRATWQIEIAQAFRREAADCRDRQAKYFAQLASSDIRVRLSNKLFSDERKIAHMNRRYEAEKEIAASIDDVVRRDAAGDDWSDYGGNRALSSWLQEAYRKCPFEYDYTDMSRFDETMETRRGAATAA